MKSTTRDFLITLLFGFTLMVVGFALVVVGGCMTTYTINKNMVDGSSVSVTVKSFREFEQPQVHYVREGENVTFDFGAESATTGTSPIEEAIADGFRAGTIVTKPPD